MIDLEEIKKIMYARSEVLECFENVFSEAPDVKEIFLLGKAVKNMTDRVEITDEKDELLEGVNDLSQWFSKVAEAYPECMEFLQGGSNVFKSKTEDLEEHIVTLKLKEEFENLFCKPDGLSREFPFDSGIVNCYDYFCYKSLDNFSPENIVQMLSFMKFVAKKIALETNIKQISKMISIQSDFVEKYIMSLLSDFCSVLYENSVDYGVYRYIAVIFHGYMNYDLAILNYF